MEWVIPYMDSSYQGMLTSTQIYNRPDMKFIHTFIAQQEKIKQNKLKELLKKAPTFGDKKVKEWVLNQYKIKTRKLLRDKLRDANMKRIELEQFRNKSFTFAIAKAENNVTQTAENDKLSDALCLITESTCSLEGSSCIYYKDHL